jgi:hypothetical protein
LDTGSEGERLKYITPGAGQAMSYREKLEEAVTYLAASSPKADDYPLLASEVGITADDLAGAVKAKFDAWRLLETGINQARLTANAAIFAAKDTASTMDTANSVS